MANSRSAKKRIRSNEAKHLRNKAVRSAVRTKVGHARRLLLSGEATNSEAELRAAVSALDRAAEKGILHRNNAARRKSRLTSLASKLTRVGDDQAKVRLEAAGGEKGKSAQPATKRGAKPAAKVPAGGVATKKKTAAARAPRVTAASKTETPPAT